MCIGKKEKIKEMLLSLLDTDDEIQQKIRQIIGKKDHPSTAQEANSSINLKMEFDNSEKEELKNALVIIDELTKKNQEAERKCKALQQQLQQTNKELSGKRLEIETLTEQYNEGIAEKETTIKELADEVNSLKTELNEAHAETQKHKQKEKSLEISLKGCMEEKQKLSDCLTESSSIIKGQNKKIADTEKKLNALQQMIEPFQAIYSEYQKIPDSIKRNLSGIFVGDSMWDFVFCGMREEILPSLWDQWLFLQQQNSKAISSLEKIFMFFFDRINRLHETPDYVLVAPRIGSEFDDDIASRDHSSNARGKVERVLLPGFSYASNKKIVRKPRVHVK